MNEYEVVSMPISDGTEREFAIIDTFEVRHKQYMALSLIEDDEIKEGIYIYRYYNAEDGDVVIEEIAEPDEYNKAVAAYQKKQIGKTGALK